MTPGALVMQRFLTAFHVLVLTALAAGPAGATVHGEQADTAPNAGPEGQRQVPDAGWSAGYDGTDVVCELDSSGNLAAHMSWGPDGLVTRRVSSTTTYYAFDAHGSVALTLDANGDAVTKHGWDAYGTSIGSAPSGPYGYGAQWGYYTDGETGLCALTFRAYDPATGRFLTRDPIGYAGGVNLYGYVGGNPGNGVDPEGLQGGAVGFDWGTAQTVAGVAGGFAVADGPLPIGDAIGVGIIVVGGGKLVIDWLGTRPWERWRPGPTYIGPGGIGGGGGTICRGKGKGGPADTSDDFWPNGKPKSRFDEKGDPLPTPPRVRTGRNIGHPKGAEHGRNAKGNQGTRGQRGAR